MGFVMMIETRISRKLAPVRRIARWALTHSCVSIPPRRLLFRGGNQDPAYYFGTRLRQQLVNPGGQKFVARTRTVADPFDVLYHANPCC
jgi:hypothetical protein